MAPEVIEMKPFITTACDIWSLGCTVFELLKGSPPNFDLNQFSAMIKIVQDAGQMTLPEGISAELADFLNQCFRKDPDTRPSATALLEHRWLLQMSNESKIAKIMNLKLPQEVHNTIRVHLKKQRERELTQQETKILSPSTIIEDRQPSANIVKLQHFQSRNTLQSSNSIESKPKPQNILAQKNLIKLQSSRQQSQVKSPQKKAGNLIDLRDNINKKLNVVLGDVAGAPESQQVTEYVATMHDDNDKNSVELVQFQPQIVSIQLKQTAQTRNKSALAQQSSKDNHLMSQWQTSEANLTEHPQTLLQKQFYQTQDETDYANKSVPVLADHSFKLSKSPKDSHDSKINQQLYTYSQQVPKKSPHAPSAPVFEKSAASSHSNLIARKPQSALQQHQVRLSSQAAMTVVRQNQKPIQLTTPMSILSAPLQMSKTPAQQNSNSSVFQTYEPASSDQKARIQQSRTAGTRTALSTLSAASYPTQPLLHTASEQIMQHPQHKSLGLVNKPQPPRQRSPTNPPVLRFQHKMEEIEDQDSTHQLLFTQVLERSLGRKGSASALAMNSHQMTISQRPQNSDYKRHKQQQQSIAIQIAKELLDVDCKDQYQLLKKAYQSIKDPEFSEVFMREVGGVTLVSLLQQHPQLVLQICIVISEGGGLDYLLTCGLISQMTSLSAPTLVVHIAQMIDIILNQNKEHMLIQSGGLQIITTFMLSEDQSIVQRSIDWILELYDRRNKRISNEDLSRLIDVSVLQELVASLIQQADSQYRHDSLDQSRIVSNKTERLVDKSFDILFKMCATTDVKQKIIRSQLLRKVQTAISECLHEPTAITFTLTKWFIQLVDLCAAGSSRKDVQAVLHSEVDLTLQEILRFYLSLVPHIQLASIYETLKLLLVLIRGSPDAVQRAIVKGSILQITEQLYTHLDANEKSRTKRSKLLQVCCNLWQEGCLSGCVKLMQKHNIHRLAFSILEKEIIQNQAKKSHSQDLALKLVTLLVTWQSQDNSLDYMIAEHLQLIIAADVSPLLLQAVKQSPLLANAISQQQNLSQMLYMLQHGQGDKKAYYEVLLYLKNLGLNIEQIASFISPPNDLSDSVTRSLFGQLLNTYESELYDEVQDSGIASGIESTSEEFN